ncbi:hypothetical protein B0H14DRAFT_2597251 [Mycena olivaceomarginata]|nr:hypothetical protein B0H14DRAFT_2597251 [Mycena olivaceomarginata]
MNFRMKQRGTGRHFCVPPSAGAFYQPLPPPSAPLFACRPPHTISSRHLQQFPDADTRMPSPEPPPYSAWPESESVPLYDLDEIIAGLTLDDGKSAAGFTAQRTPNSQVTAVRKVRTPARAKRAYVVFRGREIGVFDTWVIPAGNKPPGPSNLPSAKGGPAHRSLGPQPPVSSTDAPQPVVQEDGAAVFLGGRQIGDPCVECALNVLGIRDSMHEKVPGFAEARDKFHRAREAGKYSAVSNAPRDVT